jgi:cobalt-zinc-cadmium efflux system protein
MSHDHDHHSLRARERSGRELIWALAITGLLFALELVGGFLTNSLALIADAAHMLTDLAALGLSLFAHRIAHRPATHQKTFGYLRAEILAALANGVILVVIAIYIFFEAYQRFRSVPEVKGTPMLIIAVLGLLANLATAAMLYRSQKESLNMRGAFLHVVGDAVGSIGAIVAGIAMVLWRWYLADPIVSVLVAILVLISSWSLVRESVDVLLEGTPSHLNIADILEDLGSVEGVVAVHDLHVWSITSGMPAMSCHVVVSRNADPSDILSKLSRMMREKRQIQHTTIQTEVENLIEPASILKRKPAKQ